MLRLEIGSFHTFFSLIKTGKEYRGHTAIVSWSHRTRFDIPDHDMQHQRDNRLTMYRVLPIKTRTECLKDLLIQSKGLIPEP